jgi:hypothetical protein
MSHTRTQMLVGLIAREEELEESSVKDLYLKIHNIVSKRNNNYGNKSKTLACSKQYCTLGTVTHTQYSKSLTCLNCAEHQLPVIHRCISVSLSYGLRMS